MTLSASVALRTAAPQVDMMEGDSESLEADLNSSLDISEDMFEQPGQLSHFCENNGNLPIPMDHYPQPSSLPGPSAKTGTDAQGPKNGSLQVGGRFVLLDGTDHERTTVELDQVFDAVMVNAPQIVGLMKATVI